MRHPAAPAVVLALASLSLVACENPDYERPDRAQQVAEADELFEPAVFDTITWASAAERLAAGNEVYAVHCRKCHGSMGRGDTPYARQEGVDVPSLVAADWPVGDDPVGVRRRIFIGHPGGMPTWGIAGISAREIDAVAHYIVHQLRPDAAAEEARARDGS
jgi:mono/diheme cytochrome c family protein